MSRLDDILEKNKMTEKGVTGIYNLFLSRNIELLNKLTNFSETDLQGLAKIKDCIGEIALDIASDFYDYLMTIEASIVNLWRILS